MPLAVGDAAAVEDAVGGTGSASERGVNGADAGGRVGGARQIRQTRWRRGRKLPFDRHKKLNIIAFMITR